MGGSSSSCWSNPIQSLLTCIPSGQPQSNILTLTETRCAGRTYKASKWGGGEDSKACESLMIRVISSNWEYCPWASLRIDRKLTLYKRWLMFHEPGSRCTAGQTSKQKIPHRTWEILLMYLNFLSRKAPRNIQVIMKGERYAPEQLRFLANQALGKLQWADHTICSLVLCFIHP